MSGLLSPGPGRGSRRRRPFDAGLFRPSNEGPADSSLGASEVASVRRSPPSRTRACVGGVTGAAGRPPRRGGRVRGGARPVRGSASARRRPPPRPGAKESGPDARRRVASGPARLQPAAAAARATAGGRGRGGRGTGPRRRPHPRLGPLAGRRGGSPGIGPGGREGGVGRRPAASGAPHLALLGAPGLARRPRRGPSVALQGFSLESPPRAFALRRPRRGRCNKGGGLREGGGRGRKEGRRWARHAGRGTETDRQGGGERNVGMEKHGVGDPWGRGEGRGDWRTWQGVRRLRRAPLHRAWRHGVLSTHGPAGPHRGPPFSHLQRADQRQRR